MAKNVISIEPDIHKKMKLISVQKQVSMQSLVSTVLHKWISEQKEVE